MKYIVSRKGVTHAADYRRSMIVGLPWQGDTRCGKRIFGFTAGECIVPLIDCKSCRNQLRKAGWSV